MSLRHDEQCHSLFVLVGMFKMFSNLCASLVVPAGAQVSQHMLFPLMSLSHFLHSGQVLQYHFLFG